MYHPVPQWYLKTFWFKPCGLEHVPPTGTFAEQDWNGGWVVCVCGGGGGGGGGMGC